MARRRQDLIGRNPGLSAAAKAKISEAAARELENREATRVLEARARRRANASFMYNCADHVIYVMPQSYFDSYPKLTEIHPITPECQTETFIHKIMAFDLGESQYSYGLDHFVRDGYDTVLLTYQHNNSCMCTAFMFSLYLSHFVPREREQLLRFGREVLSMGYAFYIQHNKEEITHLCMKRAIDVFDTETRQESQHYIPGSEADQLLVYELLEDVGLVISALTLGSRDLPRRLPLAEIRAEYNSLSDFDRICQSRFFCDYTAEVDGRHAVEVLLSNFIFCSNDRFANLYKRCNLVVAMHCNDDADTIVRAIRLLQTQVDEIYARMTPANCEASMQELEVVLAAVVEQTPSLHCFFDVDEVPLELLIEATQAVHTVDLRILRRLISRAIKFSFQLHSSNPEVYEGIYQRLDEAKSTNSSLAQLAIIVTRCMTRAASRIHGVNPSLLNNTTAILKRIIGPGTPPWALEVHINPKGMKHRCETAALRYMPDLFTYENRAGRRTKASAPFTRANLVNMMIKESLARSQVVACIITTQSRSFCVATREREFFVMDSHRVTRAGNAVIMYTQSQTAITEALGTHNDIGLRGAEVSYTMYAVSREFAPLAINLLDSYNTRGDPANSRVRL